MLPYGLQVQLIALFTMQYPVKRVRAALYIRCMHLCRSPFAAVLRCDARLWFAPRNVATVQTRPAMFTCVAPPESSPRLDWMEFVTRPEGSLVARGLRVVHTTRTARYHVRVRGTLSELVLVSTRPGDAGRYACVDSVDGHMGFAELIVLRECACARMYLHVCIRVCLCVCVCVCACACVRASVRACVRTCVRARACVRVYARTCDNGGSERGQLARAFRVPSPHCSLMCVRTRACVCVCVLTSHVRVRPYMHVCVCTCTNVNVSARMRICNSIWAR